MLKRLYTRFLLWALTPAIKEMRISASQVKVTVNDVGSRYVASSDFMLLADRFILSPGVGRCKSTQPDPHNSVGAL